MVFKKILIVGIMVSLTVLMSNLLIDDVGQEYGRDVNTSETNVTSQFTDIINKSDTIREQLTQTQELSTVDSLAGFFNAGFTSATLVFDVIPLISSLISQLFTILPIHPFVQLSLLAVAVIIVTIALIALITGRIGILDK